MTIKVMSQYFADVLRSLLSTGSWLVQVEIPLQIVDQKSKANKIFNTLQRNLLVYTSNPEIQ